MRPYKMTVDRGLQPDMCARLYVKRDCFTGPWRLAWMVPGADTYSYAEGECSKRLFRTRRGAIAYGQRVYGETAARWEE